MQILYIEITWNRTWRKCDDDNDNDNGNVITIMLIVISTLKEKDMILILYIAIEIYTIMPDFIRNIYYTVVIMSYPETEITYNTLIESKIYRILFVISFAYLAISNCTRYTIFF